MYLLASSLLSPPSNEIVTQNPSINKFVATVAVLSRGTFISTRNADCPNSTKRCELLEV